ncbi:hypothetical protein EUX98_g5349 [Antrodiella citrinella]|uniref:F-box domain-containing protein n=1 Tax=Antrodiella citrinella TaxID=2447956 RepID=A0A4S4MRM9_9APHY|nr:hypothetical protein EUX98_g5349 [Antrodiella citrinella]
MEQPWIQVGSPRIHWTPKPWDGTGAEDVLLKIFSCLEIREIMKMRRCCKEFRRISQAKQLWVSILQRDVLEDSLAYPFVDPVRPLEELSAAETEAVTTHLVRMQRRDLAPTPRVVRVDQVRSVTWVKLVHGAWLLVATSDADASSIALWKISDILRDESHAKPVSEAFLPAAVRDGVVDVQDGSLVIALSLCAK